MFDAYTVKKVLPRLVIAAILIQLSWPLFTLAIQVVSQIAWGLEGLLYAPFGGREALNVGVLVGRASGSVEATTAGLVALIAGGAGAVSLGAAGMLSLGITILLALLIGFFVLAIRQVVIVVLLVTAPLALLCWVLPNTEKIWKIWWESFSKLLLMYPLILLLIAGGRVAAYLAANTNTGNDGFDIAIVLLAFFGPFFLIPKTFQLAGSAFANITGIANNRSRGAFDRLKKGRENTMAKNTQALKTGQRFGGRTWIPGSQAAANRVNRMTRGVATGTRGNFGLGGRGAAAQQSAIETAAMDVMKSAGWQAMSQNDDALMAATYDSEAAARTALQARWGDQARVDRAINAYKVSGYKFGDQASQYASARQLVSTGTGYNDLQDMTETLGRVAHGNAGTASALAGFANAETKKVGRFDLAPSYGTLNNLVQRQTGSGTVAGGAPTLGDYAGAMDDNWRSAGLYQLASGKTTSMEQFAEHHLRRLETGTGEQRRAAAIALMEMQNMLPNATGANQEVINRTMQEMRDYAGREHGLDFNSGVSVEEQIAAVATAGSPRFGAMPVGPTGGALTGADIRGMARTYDRETADRRGAGVLE